MVASNIRKEAEDFYLELACLDYDFVIILREPGDDKIQSWGKAKNRQSVLNLANSGISLCEQMLEESEKKENGD